MNLRNESASQHTIVVGLVADPDLSTRVANSLVRELPNILAREVSDQVTWEIRVTSEIIPLDRDGDIPLVEYARAKIPWEEWDLMVLLTDLPRRVDGKPVVGEYSVAYSAAQVSLPAVGWTRLRANVRDTIAYFVDAITRWWAVRPEGVEEDGRTYLTRWPGSRTSAVRSFPSSQEGVDAYLGLVGMRGKMRLLFGAVRNNRPWRLVGAMSSATATAAAGAAFGIFFSNVWSLADALPPVRLALISVLAVTVMVLWLILYNRLWERPASPTAQEQALLYNVSTVITLFLGVTLMYALLFAAVLAGAAVVITGTYLRQILGHPVGAADYASLAWLATSMGIVAGALGSGLESEHAVRRATYSRRQRERQDIQHRQDRAAAGASTTHSSREDE